MSQNQFIKHSVTISVYHSTWLMLLRICEREMRRPGPQLSWYLALMAGQTTPLRDDKKPRPELLEDPFWREEYQLRKIEHTLYRLFCENEYIRPAPTGLILFPDEAERDRILSLGYR